jgi:hypothetical protein
MTHHEETTPGPELDDPELEAQRKADAAERERESRASDETKFEQLRREADDVA